jgi:hypothetical protein
MYVDTLAVLVHGRGADLPFFLRFGTGPIVVQINL